MIRKLIKENPDKIRLKSGKVLDHISEDAYVFGYYKGKLKVQLLGTHPSLFNAPISFSSIREVRNKMKYPGRMWIDYKVMSFWKYPPDSYTMKKIADDISKEMNNISKDMSFDIWNDFEVEVLVPDNNTNLVNTKSKWDSKSLINVKPPIGHKSILIPVKEYKGSMERKQAELSVSHIQSPMSKLKKHIPFGMGSKKRIAGMSPSQVDAMLGLAEVNLKDINKSTVFYHVNSRKLSQKDLRNEIMYFSDDYTEAISYALHNHHLTTSHIMYANLTMKNILSDISVLHKVSSTLGYGVTYKHTASMILKLDGVVKKLIEMGYDSFAFNDTGFMTRVGDFNTFVVFDAKKQVRILDVELVDDTNECLLKEIILKDKLKKPRVGVNFVQLNLPSKTSDETTTKLSNIIENNIATISKNITVKINIEKTIHTGNRQYRHEENVITDEQIISAADKALPKIMKLVIANTIKTGSNGNKGTYIGIHDSSTDVNIICVLERDSQTNMLNMIVLTTIKKQKFFVKSGTIYIKV